MRVFHIDAKEDFRVLGGTERGQAAIMTLAPGDSEGGTDNRHEESDQWLYVVSGTGKAVVNGRQVDLKPGVLLLIEAGETHEIVNTGFELLDRKSVV